jgi:hypothetical protein
MELNVLLRGQSNAVLLSESPDWNIIQSEVQLLLGFDVVTNKVNLLEADPSNAAVDGDNTAVGGTAFIGDWISATDGTWQDGWTNQTDETGLLNYINALPAAEKSAPTAIVWLQNEYDSTNPTLTTAEWMSGVSFEATQVRAALGQSAATTPYVFVNAIPYGSGSIDSVNQAIKLGMDLFTGEPGFNATIGAQANDVDMDYGQTGIYGGPHMDAADSDQTDARLALSIAESFKQYALPGSPLATGQIDAFGPELMAAVAVAGNQVLVTAALDAGAALDATLDSDAANGIGWSIITTTGQQLSATAAQVVNADQVLLTFGGTVPVDGSGSLYYGYGYGRLATGYTDPGEGNAIYDTQNLPVWTPATGVTVEGTAAGTFVEQNLVTGGVTTLAGSVSGIAGYDSQVAAISPESVALAALTPNAVLFAGLGADVLMASSGNNLLDAGLGNTLMVGGSGDDSFVVNASGPAVWDVIDNFHAGDTMVLWGFTAGTSAFNWTNTSAGATLAAVGGGIASSAEVAFQGFTAAQAASFTQTTGTSDGMSYLVISNHP